MTDTSRIFLLDQDCSIEGCDAKYYGNTFCKKHHQWHWKRGLLPKPHIVTPGEKITSFSQVDTATGCWVWQRHTNNKGYGLVYVDGQKQYAHRVSYQTFHGRIPEWFEVCHRCDNPPCVNPDHLFIGTHAQNMRDSVNKGRAKQKRPEYGLAHNNAAFSREQVLLIRSTPETATSLGRKLGVSHSTVRRCRNGETYQDVSA